MTHQDPRLPDNVRALRPADAEQLLQHLIGAAANDPMAGMFTRTAPEPWAVPEQTQCFTVRVDLDDAKPPIWRRLSVAGDMRLSELHDVLQAAMGWTDSHLHHFQMGPDGRDRRRAYFVEPFAESEGDDGIVERDVRLDQVVAEPGHRLFYEYDFGDGWEHTITVESVTPLEPEAPRATCLAGRRACPPEDVGGIPGYEEVLAAWNNPDTRHSDQLLEMLDWLPDGFDPAKFEVAEADASVRRASGPLLALLPADLLALPLREVVSGLDDRGSRLVAQWFAEAMQPCELDEATAAALTAPWRALLDAVGDGLALTGAGYLPPAVVSSLLERLPVERLWGKGNREEYTPPIANLHETARVIGLVRKSKGSLLPTTLGRRLHQDPDALARHLAARVAPGKHPHERDAEWLTVLAAGAGIEDPYADIARLLAGIGWREESGGPLEWHHAFRSARFTRAVLGLAGWNPDRFGNLEHDPRARVLARLALHA